MRIYFFWSIFLTVTIRAGHFWPKRSKIDFGGTKHSWILKIPLMTPTKIKFCIFWCCQRKPEMKFSKFRIPEMGQMSIKKHLRIRGIFYYETKVLWRRQFTCIDIHKNSKMRHSISLRKFDRVFENSKMRHLKSWKILKWDTSNVRKF